MSGWLSNYDDANHYQKQSGYSALLLRGDQSPERPIAARRIIFRNGLFFP
jgi:hypothetical protein